MARRKLMNQMNVVPYIDVMLVLLVIFMVTAPMVNHGQIDLPSVGQSTTAPTHQPIEVIIAEDGNLTWRQVGDSQASAIELPALIEQLRQRQNQQPDLAVVIAAHKAVRYEKVLAVMDALQQQQIRKVGLLVKSAQG